MSKALERVHRDIVLGEDIRKYFIMNTALLFQLLGAPLC